MLPFSILQFNLSSLINLNKQPNQQTMSEQQNKRQVPAEAQGMLSSPYHLASRSTLGPRQLINSNQGDLFHQRWWKQSREGWQWTRYLWIERQYRL